MHPNEQRDRCALWSQRSLDGQPINRTLPGTPAVVPLAPYITSFRANPPDDAGSWDLNQRTIGRAYELGGRWLRCATLTKIAHRTVVRDPSATVRPESDVERTIERVLAIGAHERL